MTFHFIAGLFELFASAKIVETADGALMIQSATGRYIAWGLGFLIVSSLTLWCWRRRIGGPFPACIFFASLSVPLLTIPGFANEFVRVAPDAVTIRTGFWFHPTDHIIPLTDLDLIVETEEATERGAPRNDIFWEFRYRTGPPHRLNLPDLLEANRSRVIHYLRARGFEIHE